MVDVNYIKFGVTLNKILMESLEKLLNKLNEYKCIFRIQICVRFNWIKDSRESVWNDLINGHPTILTMVNNISNICKILSKDSVECWQWSLELSENLCVWYSGSWTQRCSLAKILRCFSVWNYNLIIDHPSFPINLAFCNNFF